MATLSAASRLRNQVLDAPNTVLLVRAGHPDSIIRFNREPEIIVAHRRRKVQERFPNLDERSYKSQFGVQATVLNLDNGPDSETWENAQNEIRANSRRDRPIPMPSPVALNSQEEWSISPEDVPVIEFNITESVKSEAPQIGEPEAPVAVAEKVKRGPGRPKKSEA